MKCACTLRFLVVQKPNSIYFLRHCVPLASDIYKLQVSTIRLSTPPRISYTYATPNSTNIIVKMFARPNAGIIDWRKCYIKIYDYEYIMNSLNITLMWGPNLNLGLGSKTFLGSPAIWFMRFTYLFM